MCSDLTFTSRGSIILLKATYISISVKRNKEWWRSNAARLTEVVDLVEIPRYHRPKTREKREKKQVAYSSFSGYMVKNNYVRAAGDGLEMILTLNEIKSFPFFSHLTAKIEEKRQQRSSIKEGRVSNPEEAYKDAVFKEYFQSSIKEVRSDICNKPLKNVYVVILKSEEERSLGQQELEIYCPNLVEEAKIARAEFREKERDFLDWRRDV